MFEAGFAGFFRDGGVPWLSHWLYVERFMRECTSGLREIWEACSEKQDLLDFWECQVVEAVLALGALVRAFMRDSTSVYERWVPCSETGFASDFWECQDVGGGVGAVLAACDLYER